MAKIDVPAVLRAIRASQNLTQEQLADRLGVSFATVNRWEGGTSAPQKAARTTILALAEEAGVDIEDAASAAAQVTRRRRGSTRSATPTTKPMEQMLWDAACSIRGEKDAAKFKDYLLPLLFLKRLSDVFDDEIARLAEEYGDRATALEIAESDHALLRFYLPREARWAVISGREPFDWPSDEHGRSTRPRDIGEHLTKAVRAVVRQNPSLSGVIDVVDFAGERNGERDINPAKLREVVETFSDPRYRLGLADVQPDFLGRAYEYLLRKFAEGSGQSAGEFFTPTEVGFLMAHILRPRPGEECHDYACGSAGLLVKLQLVARELDPTSKVPLKLYGQELTAESYAVAKMNAIIHDMSVELARGDSMIKPKFKSEDGKRIRTYDIVVANPMWNQPFNPDLFADDPFDRFRPHGGITSGKGDWAWLQHTLACLNDRGRAAVVLDTGAVTRGSGSKNEDRERNIRKWFVDRDLIDGVILLPENLFYNTTAAGVIVVLSKRKPAARKDRIILFNASRRMRKGRPKNFIDEEDIRPLASAYLAGEEVEGEVAVVTCQEVKDADYDLSPGRWAQADGSFDVESVATLLQELVGIEQRSRELSERLSHFFAGSLTNERAAQGRQLFAHGAGNQRRKETKIGLLPESWRIVKLGSVFETQLGKMLSQKARGGDSPKPYLRNRNVQWGRIDLSDVLTMDFDEREEEKFRLVPGDLLVCEGGAVGRAAIWRGELAECFFQKALHRIRPRTGVVSNEFLYHWMRFAFEHQNLYNVGGASSTIAHLPQAQLEELDIPLPEEVEQRRIVSLLDAFESKIALSNHERNLLESLSKAMLHHLMTGEVSVEDVDIAALSFPSATPSVA